MIVATLLSGVVVGAPAAHAADTYRLQFAHSSKCLDVPGKSKDNGVQLIQYTCNGGTNQNWYLDYATTRDSINYYRIRNQNSGKCVNVAGNSSADGAHIIQWTCGAYNNEYFAFVANDVVGAPWSWVMAYHSRKVLNVQGASTANSAKVIQWTKYYQHNSYLKYF